MIAKSLFVAAIVATVALAAPSANAAAVYFGIEISNAKVGGTNIADGTAVLVLDLTNDGWQGIAYDAQTSGGKDNSLNWLFDSADYNIGTYEINAGYVFIEPDEFDVTMPTGFQNGTTHAWVLWFDESFGSTTPGKNTPYGAYDCGALSDGGSYTPVINPAPTTMTTLPEPATIGLLGVGLVGILLRRRRRRA